MAEIKDGGPAFPSHGSMGEVVQEGMSLLDYFAAHAPDVPEDFDWEATEIHTYERRARWAYVYADAMLKAREVQNG